MKETLIKTLNQQEAELWPHVYSDAGDPEDTFQRQLDKFNATPPNITIEPWIEKSCK